MTQESENTDATANEKRHDYVETVRNGAVAANIFVSRTEDGENYHYFRLSRSWKSVKTQKTGYSDRFFAQNVKAIGEVAIAAASRCDLLDRTQTNPAAAAQPRSRGGSGGF